MEPGKIESILIEAVQYIFPEIGADTFDVRAKKDIQALSELIVTTGITGDIKGILMIKTLYADAVSIANIMLRQIGQVPEQTALTQSHKEAISEFANLVSGRFLNILSMNEIDCNMTPPTIITGSGILSAIPNMRHSIDLRITSNSWALSVSLGILSP
jgi:CheY-specific phosphatase CheX